MNRKVLAIVVFISLMSLGQLLEGGVLSFILLLCCAALVAQLDEELKLWILRKINNPTLSVPSIEKYLSIKLSAGLFLLALITSPQALLDKSEALSSKDKREVKDHGHLAKQFCHVYIKLAMKDEEDASVSFPYTSHQFKGQTYVTNAKSKHENAFGGKTKLEWDCQINLDNSDDAGNFESWDLEILENRKL